MELASSSVRTPSQCLAEGVACIRASDSGGASHAVVASSSFSSSASSASSSSSSSYGVFLSGRSCVAPRKACGARVVASRDRLSCGLSGSLYRSFELERPGGSPRARCSVCAGCKLGQFLAAEGCTLQGDVAGPSGRIHRTDFFGSYLDVSMGPHGLVCGSRNLLIKKEKLSRNNWPSSSFSQLCHASASAGRTSKSGPQVQKKTVNSNSGHSGWNVKRTVGLIKFPSTSKRTASCNRITSSVNERINRKQAKRCVQTFATPSDYRMSYPDVSADAVASCSYLIQDGDTLTSIANKFKTSVPVLAQVNKIENVDLLLAGQPILIPRAYERVPGPGVDIDEFPVPSGYELRTSPSTTVYHQLGYTSVPNAREATSNTPAQESRSQVLAASVMLPPVGPNFAKFAVPVLLIAPLLGFCIRCIVDALYIHMDKEAAKQQSERESYVETHRPKAKRWQRILEEDRDSDDGEGPNLMNDWPKDNVWSSELTGPTENIWSSEVTDLMDPDAREMTREILSMEQEDEVVIRDEKEDYEDIRKSYAELESSYMKFLVDSGLSKSGYWRGGVPTTTAHNGEPQ
ncbi:hypothetical protein MPTK1_6g08460 [Marchantia polymorpha subsp. ruderalis]|uniref:LysM domain-containing protein n=2 Tax=Marchantia polymorpha TaxID=3197 RepID=A0AAF6BPW8_MARPO|nr:hypothetical protein MARPO_0060s0075 [Marchantia polymorpha]BBN14052.1 hypothetical protein Mp_6g08460 [Marchantia polymorpha subsp. ruderalis]|eukprot:PTQ36993.1 hypothetical protein MARPO_0060s0075 [Marchantia polymorpha]